MGFKPIAIFFLYKLGKKGFLSFILQKRRNKAQESEFKRRIDFVVELKKFLCSDSTDQI
jgi:hypothetical protein